MLAEVLVLTYLLAYLAIKWLKYYKVPEDFPPGPPCVPGLGVLPFIKHDFKASMMSWLDTYGEVVGLKLGADLAVVLNDFQDISSAFKDPRLTGRPKSLQETMSAFFASGKRETNGGIVFTHGQQWTEQRRFALKTLREFGFGKKDAEESIRTELEELCQAMITKQDSNNSNLKKSGGTLGCQQDDDDDTSLNLSRKLSTSVVNSIWSMLTGEKFQQGDAEMESIISGTEKFVRNESLHGPIMMLPWLRHLPVIRQRFEASKEAGPLKMRALQDATVKRHIQRKLSGESKHSFIDVYLKKIEETKDDKSSFYGDQGRINLQRSLTDLFGAGSETSSSMLLFCFLYMIRYQKVQQKVQEEIIGKVGPEGRVTLADRSSLPYTDAVLHEVMRHSCLVYVVPHAATEDLNVQHYLVPKGASVYANVWRVMHDSNYWRDPEKFIPERFLDSSGKFRRDERCIPFMLGRRFCIGQTLAQDQLFLFFAGLLREFEFRPVSGQKAEEVSTVPVVGFIHSCPNYQVNIKRRVSVC